jgi:hypothetical protein
MLKLNDNHVHWETTMDNYDLEVEYQHLIFNSIDEYKRYRKTTSSPQQRKKIISVIFPFRESEELNYVISEINNSRIHGLKIHSKIQKIQEIDYDLIVNKLLEIPEYLPITLCTFYDGINIENQPSLYGISKLVRIFPSRNFILAHAGGYNMLQYFFHFRHSKNVFYCLSLSLKYLSDSSVGVDIGKVLKFIKAERILFGSDYPSASPREQFDVLNLYFNNLGICSESQQKILYSNMLELFNANINRK